MTKTLLPIGTRVTHWNGARGTHGKGTIIAYNGIKPNNYLNTNFKDAVELAGKAGLLNALLSSSYDGVRWPYIVQFDPRETYEGESELSAQLRTKYPRGYKDVYGDEMKPLEPDENIFPNDCIQVMSRCWNVNNNNKWSPWITMSIDLYKKYSSDEELSKTWQFCVRP